MKKVKVQRRDERGFIRKLFNLRDKWGHRYDPVWMESIMEDEDAAQYHMLMCRYHNVVLETVDN